MNHGVTSVVENPAAATRIKGVMTLATVLLSTAILTMANLEYPYTLANATSMTNLNHVDATHSTHCDGDICEATTCINNNCQSLSNQLNQVANSNQPDNQPYNQPQSSNQPYNQPQSSNQLGLGSTTCYLPCLPSR
ncbi:MAG TPA: hypothetical protein VEH06_00495 [Candidatus Bathyarchaeia archaeon]|nr:hypothetical protein [Candidatus Bathyarchaeia archaeon]